MSHKKFLYEKKTKSNTGFGAIATNTVKSIDNKRFKLGLAVSLAAVCLSKPLRSANATEINDSVAPNSFSGINSDSDRSRSKFSLLPRIFNRLGQSTKTQTSNLTQTKTKTAVNIASDKPDGIASLRDLRKSPVLVAATDSTSSKPSQPVYRIHQVKVGDTINQIAKKYGVSRDELVKLNRIRNSNVIFVDRQLKIPPASSTAIPKSDSVPLTQKTASSQNNGMSVSATTDPHLAKLKADIDLLRQQYGNEAKANKAESRLNSPDPFATDNKRKTEASEIRKRSAASKQSELATRSSLTSNLLPEDAIALTLPPLPPSEEYLPQVFEGYIWPAQGVLTSGYGYRWGRMHRGIDIAAPIGTPILAAAAGTVIDAGWQNGYGYLVKVEHLDGSVTVYAHNNRNLVTYGQKVQQGEQIAEMGNTGYSTGSHLHFEIITKDQKIIDPLALLSSR